MSDDRRTAITNDQIETFNDPINGDSLKFNTSEDMMEWGKIISQFPWTALDCGDIITDRVITYYDSLGGTNINNGAVIDFDTVITNSDLFAFSVASGVITCNITDTYFIVYDVSVNCSTSDRSKAEHFLEIDDGSGFAIYNGSKSYSYHRNTTAGATTTTCTILVNLSKNDKVRVYTQRIAGTANLITVANASRLSIFPKNVAGQINHFGLDCGDIAESTNNTQNQIDCGEI